MFFSCHNHSSLVAAAVHPGSLTHADAASNDLVSRLIAETFSGAGLEGLEGVGRELGRFPL